MIQPTPPPFPGEERGSTRKGHAQGHSDIWALRKDANKISFSPVLFPNSLVFHIGGLQDGKGGTGPRRGSRKAYQTPPSYL